MEKLPQHILLCYVILILIISYLRTMNLRKNVDGKQEDIIWKGDYDIL